MHFLANWTMPVEAGGAGRDAVIFDHDYKFPTSRFVQILDGHVANEDHRREALERIKLVTCATTMEYLAALELVNNQTEHRDDGILVVVETCGAFFWREDKPASEGLAPPSFTPACCRSLARLLREDKSLVIASKPAFFKKKVNTEMWTHEEYMPKEWTKLVQRRVEVALAKPSSGFDFRLFDVASDRQPVLRSHYTFDVTDTGITNWTLVSNSSSS